MQVCKDTSKILVVEDEDQLRELIGKLLKQSNFDTILCSSRDEAWKVINSEPIDIILLDIHMSGMSVDTFLDHLDDAGINPSIIFTTGGFTKKINHYLDSDNSFYLKKPFGYEELHQQIVEAQNNTKILHKE